MMRKESVLTATVLFLVTLHQCQSQLEASVRVDAEGNLLLAATAGGCVYLSDVDVVAQLHKLQIQHAVAMDRIEQIAKEQARFAASITTTPAPTLATFVISTLESTSTIFPNSYCGKYNTDQACFNDVSCIWDFNKIRCRAKGCDDFFGPAECEAREDCTFIPSAFLCHQTGVPPQCDRFFESGSCIDNGCEYDSDAIYCNKPGEVSPCSKFFGLSSCPPTRCEWAETTRSQGACVAPGENAPCALFDRGACPRHCTTGEFQCEELPENSTPKATNIPTSTSLSSASTTTTTPSSSTASTSTSAIVACEDLRVDIDCSNTAACVWDFSTGSCRAKGCDDLFSQADCEAWPAGCTFIPSAYLCHKTGEKPACSRFFDSGSCADNGCEFDSDAFFCNIAGEATPCSRYFDNGGCPDTRCEWITTGQFSGACVIPGELAPCFAFDTTACPTNRCVAGAFQCLDRPV